MFFPPDFLYRGLKSTLWEGGTRATGFIWSPLLEKSRYHSRHMMHVVDWLPTLLSAAGFDMNRLPSNLDGIDQWTVLSRKTSSARTEFLYNIDPKEPTAAIRIRDMKLIYGLGSTALFDGWYRPEQLAKNVNISYMDTGDLDDPYLNPYNKLIVDTDGAKNMPDQAHDAHTESAPDDMFHSDLVSILADIGRYNITPSPAILNCSHRPANYSTNCKPAVKPCLFDVIKDPCEFNNIAKQRPDIVKRLFSRIVLYKRYMVAPKNKKPDPRGFPYYHNGVWVPWIKLTDGKQ